MATVHENPLPACENDEELANRFANFFVDKIQKSGMILTHIPSMIHQFMT